MLEGHKCSPKMMLVFHWSMVWRGHATGQIRKWLEYAQAKWSGVGVGGKVEYLSFPSAEGQISDRITGK